MGRTVISKTENKQTIILNDSAESVSGGFFDADMEWHKLGEPGYPKKMYKVKSNTTVQSSSNIIFPIEGTIRNFSNWGSGEFPILYLYFKSSGSGLGCETMAIHNNATSNVYLTNGNTGNVETLVHDNTRLEIYIPEEYMQIALRALEEVEE